MLSSMKIPKPIGKPSLKTSLVVANVGSENSEKGFVFLYFFDIAIYINNVIIIKKETMEVAIPQPTPPSLGAPIQPYTNIRSRGIFISIPMAAIQKTGIVNVIPSL